MRITVKDTFAINSLIKLKNNDWLVKQRQAGRIAAQTLKLLEQMVVDKTTKSLLELNQIAEEYIMSSGGIPTFAGYKGFPAGVCISVNKQLVHGIPTDYKLQDGDLVSFDLGVTFEGAIADTAITCIYGDPKSELHVKLIKATNESLMKGIEAIAVGKQLGCIGSAISKYVKGTGFGLITNYGGHGLDWNTPHAAPFVNNKDVSDNGIHIQPGLAIAIEPMLVLGSTETKVADDGWTVLTNDVGAHAEHSVFIHEDRVEIITDRDNL
jgi:methionyl aminopeptidase